MPRIGLFTRLLEDGTATQRYNWALQQVRQAARYGCSTAWIAQHHVDAGEGGLPTPWHLLGAAAPHPCCITRHYKRFVRQNTTVSAPHALPNTSATPMKADFQPLGLCSGLLHKHHNTSV